MRAIFFPEANDKLGPPPGMNEDQVYTLHIFRGESALPGRTPEEEPMPMPIVISAWKMESEEERREFLRTGIIYAGFTAVTHPPMWLVAANPLKNEHNPALG